MKRFLTLVILAASAALSACGSTSTSMSATPPTPTPTPPPVVDSASVMVGTASETILVTTTGMTLYYFTNDKGGNVSCTGSCANNWPAYTLPAGVSKPTGPSSFPGPFGTVANPGGVQQITYDGWPLYTFAKDTAAGQANGQGVGGKWFVVTANIASPPPA